MVVRERAPADTAALADVFFRAVRDGAAPAYSNAERAAWAPERPDEAAWAARLDGLVTLVDEDADGCVSGFMSLRMSDGYLDLAFVRPEARGTGVASRLYAVLENRARVAGLTRLWSHASHLAKPFLARQGWEVQTSNTIERRGVTLQNWMMEKRLS
ncbi:MAG: GNAT family N-acetyltransferase [Pseudomonadota bacterium]